MSRPGRRAHPRETQRRSHLPGRAEAAGRARQRLGVREDDLQTRSITLARIDYGPNRGRFQANNLIDINLGLRIMLGSSYYEDWVNEETFVREDPLGNPVDQRHPWNQTTIPKPQKRDLDGGNYSWVMSPRWYDKRTDDYLALDTGGGALQLKEPDMDSFNGRGLLLVQTLALAWGTSSDGTGKVVWFEV